MGAGIGRWVGLDDTSAPTGARRPGGRATLPPMSAARSRHLLTAELLSIGSELTVGDTRDTNAGELARALTTLGVRVALSSSVPGHAHGRATSPRAGEE